jgi:hypothetical protein
MKAYQLTMMGLTFDILGAFLVSVEAIKTHNLRTLSDKIFRPVHDHTLSPKLHFVDDDVAIDWRTNTYLGIYIGLHYVAGLLVLVAADYLVQGRIRGGLTTIGVWVIEQPWYITVFLVLLVVLFGIVLGLWLLGEMVHVTLTYLTKLLVRAIEFIEARTPDGTVGILGFLLLLIGFMLQLIGTYKGAHGS